MESYPSTIYFVQRKSEHFAFLGGILKAAASGFNLGVNVMLVGTSLPDNVPEFFHHPGLWVEYSDGSVVSLA